MFKERTEEASAAQYFQFYGYLSQQQNMMQDFVRTSTYQKAIHSNLSDFRDKVVLDVGAGSGILSFFAQQAGAAKVSRFDFYFPMCLSARFVTRELFLFPTTYLLLIRRYMQWRVLASPNMQNS